MKMTKGLIRRDGSEVEKDRVKCIENFNPQYCCFKC